MNWKKQVVSLILVGCTIVSMLPVAFAAGQDISIGSQQNVTAEETTIKTQSDEKDNTMSTEASSTGAYSPYPEINYSYSSSVTCGTIRYISQKPSGSHFYSAYWPSSSFGSYAGPSSECGTASCSMALSYVGINKTPKQMLEAYNGVTYFSGWGETSYLTPSVSTAMNNYINGNGKYSPPMIHLNNYSAGGHYLLLIGQSGTTYQTLDPWENSVTRMTINGTTATYVKDGVTKTDAVSSAIQYYNANASKPSTPTPTPTGTRTISDGDYHIVTDLNISYGLNVAYNSTSACANIQIHNSMGDADTSSVVTVKYLDNGYYKLTMRNSGKVLDVQNASTSNGTNVQQYDDNGTDAQKWIIREAGNGCFNIISKCNGLYMDVAGGSTADYTNVQMYTGNGTSAQKWRFIAWGAADGQSISDGNYKIVSAMDNTKCVDVSGAATQNYTNVQLWSNVSNAAQTWKVKYMGNGFYMLTDINSNKNLDVSGAKASAGTNVQIYEDNGNNAQRWIIKPAGNGYYYIISKIARQHLDASEGKSANGTNLQIWYNYSSNNNAQKWKFIKEPEKTSSKFTDVSQSAYYYHAVEWAATNKITSGTTATTFSPNIICTRAQVVTFLWNMNGNPEPKTTNNPFIDIKSTDWFYKAVMWAVENRITSGTSSTTFSPNTNCTRAQTVAFLWNMNGKPTPQTTNNPFIDVRSTDWFQKAVIWAVGNKITSGTSTTTFSPNQVCTRAQVVTFLWNMAGKPQTT